jgi:hypothetical protein
MSYVYRCLQRTGCDHLWSVGYFDPEGRWQEESDHATADDAAKRVAWLNGGHVDRNEIDQLIQRVNALETKMAVQVVRLDQMSEVVARFFKPTSKDTNRIFIDGKEFVLDTDKPSKGTDQ